MVLRISANWAETEKIYQEFNARKAEIESRLKSLRAALTDAERLNKALKVGRVPAAVILVLQAIDEAGLGERRVTQPVRDTTGGFREWCNSW